MGTDNRTGVDSGRGYTVVVVIDDNQKFYFAETNSYDFHGTHEAEAQACVATIQVAKEFGIRRCVIHGDCKIILDCLN
ncbi:hypothetical protein Ancab_036034 [Ancistrocladus abbreviatus]